MWSSSPAVSSRQQLSITIFGSDKLTPKERLVWIRFPANKTATVLKLLSTVKLPQCVNLVNRGEFGIGAVLHQPIALNLPHIILGGKIDPAVIKMRVQIACVCFNLPLLLCGDSLADVPVLDMHVAPAICQQVTQQRLERGKLADPFALDKQVSAPASLPPVRQFVVWARISDKDHKSEKSHLRIARQILSMVNSPPADEIGPRFANVDKLELILEHASSWRHALAERRAYHFVQQVVADQTVVLCVNLNRVTRRLDDFNQLVDDLNAIGARLYTQTSLHHGGMLELHKLRKLAEDKNLVIVVTTWQAVNLPVLLAKVLDKGQGDQPYFPAVARNFIHSLKALAQQVPGFATHLSTLLDVKLLPIHLVDNLLLCAVLHCVQLNTGSLDNLAIQLGKPGDVKHLVYLEENQALFRMCVNKQSHAAWQHLRTDRHIDSPIFRERSAATPFY